MRWIDDFESSFRGSLINIPIMCVYIITIASIYANEFANADPALYLLLSNVFGWGWLSCVYGFLFSIKYHYPSVTKLSIVAISIYCLFNSMYSIATMIGVDVSYEHFTILSQYSMIILTAFCSLLYIRSFDKQFDKFIKWTGLK